MIEPRYKTTNRDPDANFAIEKKCRRREIYMYSKIIKGNERNRERFYRCITQVHIFSPPRTRRSSTLLIFFNNLSHFQRTHIYKALEDDNLVQKYI